MNKIILSKSTTLQRYMIIIGDNKIISNLENQKKIRGDLKNLLEIKSIENSKLASIYSTRDIEFGSISCNIYINSKIKNKLTRFHYIPINSLSNIELETLIADIDEGGQKTGEVKITTGKISFQVLGNTENKDSGFIGKASNIKNKKILANIKKEFKKWNNSFTFNVSNGTYEIYQHDFIYQKDGNEEYDTMFSVEKIT